MVGAYSASKAALVSLIRTIALENKDRCISANTVLPGTMDTPGIAAPCRRSTGRSGCSRRKWPRSWCISASDAGAQITGAAIPVYGKQV